MAVNAPEVVVAPVGPNVDAVSAAYREIDTAAADRLSRIFGRMSMFGKD